MTVTSSSALYRELALVHMAQKFRISDSCGISCPTAGNISQMCKKHMDFTHQVKSEQMSSAPRVLFPCTHVHVWMCPCVWAHTHASTLSETMSLNLDHHWNPHCVGIHGSGEGYLGNVSIAFFWCLLYVCACLVAQLHLTLCNLMDCSPPGSSAHGILQARMLELGSHSLLQGKFLTQELNPCHLHCR